MGMKNRFVNACLVVLALWPWTIIGVFYSFAFRAKSLLGRWPIAWVDDPVCIAPNDWVYQLLSFAIVAQTLGAIPVLFTLAMVLGVNRALYSDRRATLGGYIFISGWLVVLAFVALDPWERVKWFLD